MAKDTTTKKIKTSRKKTPKPKKTITYVNMKRSNPNYRDKYKKDVENAVKAYAEKLGKVGGEEFTQNEWKDFFETVLIPLDRESEKHMISLFMDNRDELNKLLVLHNTKASDNLAEVYFKKYQKESPTQWHDLDDFKQMALEGLMIAAKRFDPNRGNRFLTFATWWVLNRVRKPYSDKGAMIGHTSMQSPVSSQDMDENQTTFENVLTPDMISNDYTIPGTDEAITNPLYAMEKKHIDENNDLCNTLKHLKLSEMGNMNKDKVRGLVDYLMDIVDKNESSSNDRKIFLYLFKRIFHKCSTLFPQEYGIDKTRLTRYIEEAPKSKAELLSNLNMNEKQYEATCSKLMRRGYEGI